MGKTKLHSKIAATGISSAAWVAKYESDCGLIKPAPLQAIAPDLDDNWVIATAIATNADFIVTGDKPSLSVGEVGAIRIVTGADALAFLGGD